jgi:hypothetical protein
VPLIGRSRRRFRDEVIATRFALRSFENRGGLVGLAVAGNGGFGREALLPRLREIWTGANGTRKNAACLGNAPSYALLTRGLAVRTRNTPPILMRDGCAAV